VRESFIIGLPYKTIVELGFETVKLAWLQEGEMGFKNGRLRERKNMRLTKPRKIK
jgi:hypothetical protein